MKIYVQWNDIKIMEIEKQGEYFFTQIVICGVREARKKGLPLFYFKDVLCVSKALPYFVKRRIYDLKNSEKSPQELEMEIINKIEETHESEIKLPTDKFRINIEI